MKWVIALLMVILLSGSVMGAVVHYNEGTATADEPSAESKPTKKKYQFIAKIEGSESTIIWDSNSPKPPVSIPASELADYHEDYKRMGNGATVELNEVYKVTPQQVTHFGQRGNADRFVNSETVGGETVLNFRHGPAGDNAFVQVHEDRSKTLRIGGTKKGSTTIIIPVDPIKNKVVVNKESQITSWGGSAVTSEIDRTAGTFTLTSKDKTSKKYQMLGNKDQPSGMVVTELHQDKKPKPDGYVVYNEGGQEVARMDVDVGKSLFGKGNRPRGMSEADIPRLADVLMKHGAPLEKGKITKDKTGLAYMWESKGKTAKMVTGQGGTSTVIVGGDKPETSSVSTYNNEGELTNYRYGSGENQVSIDYNLKDKKAMVKWAGVTDPEEWNVGKDGYLTRNIKLSRLEGQEGETRTVRMDPKGEHLQIKDSKGDYQNCRREKECAEIRKSLGKALQEKSKHTTPRPKLPSSFFGRLNEILKGYSEFQGLGYWAGLFVDEEDVKKKKAELAQEFCDTIILGGTKCWTSKICAAGVDGTMGGIGVVTQDFGQPPRASAHIEAEKSEAISFYNSTLERNVTRYLYRVSYSLHNPNDEDMFYNLLFYDDTGFEYVSFIPDKKLSKGGSTQAVQSRALTKYSSRNYETVCLIWNPPIMRVGGGEVLKQCTPIIGGGGAPATAALPPPSVQQQGTPPPTPTRGDFNGF